MRRLHRRLGRRRKSRRAAAGAEEGIGKWPPDGAVRVPTRTVCVCGSVGIQVVASSMLGNVDADAHRATGTTDACLDVNGSCSLGISCKASMG